MDSRDLVTPVAQEQLAIDVSDMPLPKARSADARPSVEQLIESDRAGDRGRYLQSDVAGFDSH